MKTRDILRRARRNLAQAKARTILTSLAIAVGALTITLSLAAGAGGRQYTDDIIKTSGDAKSLSVYPKAQEDANNLLTEYGASSNSSSNANYLQQSDVDKIKTVSGVESVTPMYNIQSQYATRGDGSKKYIAPINIKSDQTEMKLLAGSLKNYTIPDGDITISEEFLPYFGFKNAAEAINQTITVNFAKIGSNLEPTQESINKIFKVVAVDGSSDTTLYYSPSLQISVNDGRAIYEYQNENNSVGEHYSALVVRVNNNADVLTVEKKITDQSYRAYSLEDMRGILLKMVNIAQWGMVAFGALAIIASIFGIINTQYISVLERTQQIGLMKALGMRKKDIARLFRYEAAWVGFLGGLIGTVLALLCGFANPLISQALKLDSSVKVLIFEPLPSIILILSMMLIAILAGYFPSRKAAKLDPIEALRTE